jgi:two-component system response regulator YesN
VKLLVVDDEIITRDGIADSLRGEYGIDEIAKADCGAMALGMIDGFKPDIMLTDIRMPMMDGIELAFRVRHLMPDCKIIFMSGYSDKSYLKSAISLKALNYIEKPIDIDDLRDTLQQAVQLKADEVRSLQQADHLQRSVQASIPLIKAEIAEELLNGKADPDLIRDKAQTAGVTIPANGHFRTVILKLAACEPLVSVDADSLRRRKLREAERLFTDEGYSCLCVLKDETMMIVHLFTANTPIRHNLLEAVCRKLGSESEAGEQLRLTMTAGPHVERLELLQHSYSRAVPLLPRSFYKGNGTLVDADCIDAATVYTTSESVASTITPFISAVQERNVPAAKETIRGLTRRLKQHEGTPVEVAKDSFLRMLTALFEKDEPMRILLTDGMPLWEKINRFQSIDDLEAFALRAVDAQLAETSESSHADPPRIVREAVRYIEQTYSDEKLSIQSLCDHIYITNTYLCSLFKAHTGQTINAYITQHRIGKARLLLSDPRLSVHQIAQLVGFSNSNYFAKVFRKVTGVKPSEYRENIPV